MEQLANEIKESLLNEIETVKKQAEEEAAKAAAEAEAQAEEAPAEA